MSDAHFPHAITAAGHVAPVARRIRATLGGEVVLDSTAAQYLWEWPYYPAYQVPAADFTTGALHDAGEAHALRFGSAVPVDVHAGGVIRERAGRRYVSSEIPDLVGTVRVEWDALDAWYEEEERVFVHPRSPYTRVDALRSRRHVQVSLQGVELASSDATVMVFETGLPTRCYFDRSAVDFSRLQRTDTVTACPYKGRTSETWSVVLDGDVHPDLAWSYDFPTLALAPIAGLVAFYDEKVDVAIDGVARPRPQTHFSR